MEQQTKSNRGGARAGAGRPATDRKITLSVRITKDAISKLNELTDNKSRYINDLILAQ